MKAVCNIIFLYVDSSSAGCSGLEVSHLLLFIPPSWVFILFYAFSLGFSVLFFPGFFPFGNCGNSPVSTLLTSSYHRDFSYCSMLFRWDFLGVFPSFFPYGIARGLSLLFRRAFVQRPYGCTRIS